jgi:hypothetical protein
MMRAPKARDGPAVILGGEKNAAVGHPEADPGAEGGQLGGGVLRERQLADVEVGPHAAHLIEPTMSCGDDQDFRDGEGVGPEDPD